MSLQISEKENNEYSEISVYSGELTQRSLIKNIAKIKIAFPDLDKGFYSILIEMARDCNFSDERFEDAVKNVICTCVYPRPTVAQFLSWDKKIKLYTYDQILKLNNELNGNAFKYYKAVIIPGVKTSYYASVSDIEQYKMKTK